MIASAYLKTPSENEPIDLVGEVLYRGSTIDSRYGPCIEVIGGQFRGNVGSLITKSGINYSLGWMELLQVVAGVYNLEAIKRVAPKANHSLFTYEMAYGPRIHYQMPKILEVLKENPDTRQAVLFVGKPEDGPTSNQPCTTSIQFLVRKEEVQAVVSMRSWDLCRGLPYDWMVFSGLTEIVAECLNLTGGLVQITAGSAHIYEDQMDNLPSLSERDWKFVDAPNEWSDFVRWAERNIATLGKGGVPTCIEYW